MTSCRSDAKSLEVKPIDIEEEDEDSGLVILKVIEENGEDVLSTLDSEEELEAVYERFMDQLFEEE